MRSTPQLRKTSLTGQSCGADISSTCFPTPHTALPLTAPSSLLSATGGFCTVVCGVRVRGGDDSGGLVRVWCSEVGGKRGNLEEETKAGILNLWVVTPLGITFQLFSVSDSHIMIHNSRKITVMS